MALPCPAYSAPISINQIRSELGTSSGSLRYLSSLAGKSDPDAMSEFYCYSNLTYSYVGYYYYIDPCSGGIGIYRGSNGRWYSSGDGLNFTDVTGQFFALYAYFDYSNYYYVYNYYNLKENEASPLYWGDTTSYCAPY